MKTLIAILFSIIVLSSCNNSVRDSYSEDSIRVLVSTGQAEFMRDSIEVYTGGIPMFVTLPIAMVDSIGFRPTHDDFNGITYKRVRKY